MLLAALAPFSHIFAFAWAEKIDEEALSGLLSILTNSMLTVVTFSLSIMVSAHLMADSNATPRAHRLLQQDGRTQTVIATFVGAFVYALAMTVMLNTGLFDQKDYAIVYAVTVGVIGMVVIAILRWVAHLSGLGSVEATLRRVEERAKSCLETRANRPFLGARDIRKLQIPANAPTFHADAFGYVQNIDTSALNDIASRLTSAVYLKVSPGDWVDKGQPLGHLDIQVMAEDHETALRDAIAIGDRREYDQDATFSLVVLAEIAERALSPGINDPHTAIDVIGRLTKLIADMQVELEDESPAAPAVYARPIDRKDLMVSTFDPIARDGRTFVEVQLSSQRAYATLSKHRDSQIADTAMALSARALSYARDGIMLVEDLNRIARFAPADHMAATSAEDPMDSVIDALGEERKSSYFTDI